MARIKNLAGRTFGRLTVTEDYRVVVSDSGRRTEWRCLCECGVESWVSTGNLGSGSTKSCGCYRSEVLNKTTHGLHLHPLYNIWCHMMARCYDSTHPTYHHYGGRGIRVQLRWHRVENFVADMSPRPKGTTLDRKDNNKGYNLKNCRWASHEEQQNNKRTNRVLTYKGESKTLAQWARFIDMPIETLFSRLKKMDIESALTTPRVRRLIRVK